MSDVAKTLIDLLPAAFSGARAIADAISNHTGSSRVSTAVEFSEEITTFIIRAERDGLDETAIMQELGDIFAAMLRKMKTGVR